MRPSPTPRPGAPGCHPPGRHPRGRARHAPVGRVVLQHVPQLPPPAVQARHDRADRRAHDVGDLLVREPFHVGEVHRDAELLGKGLQRLLDVGVREAVQRLRLRRLQARGGVLGRPGQLPVLDLFRTRPLRLALLLAVAVDERVGQDPEQPRLQVRPGLELVERRVGLGERLLDQVLGICRVPRHPQPRRVELIQEGQHIMLETLAALLECLGYRTHPLGDLPHRPTVTGRMGGRIHPRDPSDRSESSWRRY